MSEAAYFRRRCSHSGTSLVFSTKWEIFYCEKFPELHGAACVYGLYDDSFYLSLPRKIDQIMDQIKNRFTNDDFLVTAQVWYQPFISLHWCHHMTKRRQRNALFSVRILKKIYTHEMLETLVDHGLKIFQLIWKKRAHFHNNDDAEACLSVRLSSGLSGSAKCLKLKCKSRLQHQLCVCPTDSTLKTHHN